MGANGSVYLWLVVSPCRLDLTKGTDIFAPSTPQPTHHR